MGFLVFFLIYNGLNISGVSFVQKYAVLRFCFQRDGAQAARARRQLDRGAGEELRRRRRRNFRPRRDPEEVGSDRQRSAGSDPRSQDEGDDRGFRQI